MSILRYTCFISLSRAGNCDANSEMIAEVRKLEEVSGTQAMGFPAGPRQRDFVQAWQFAARLHKMKHV